MNDDGSMSRTPQLIEFADRHGLTILSIDDIIEYRTYMLEAKSPCSKMWPLTIDTQMTDSHLNKE